jgi:hypothetical protein
MTSHKVDELSRQLDELCARHREIERFERQIITNESKLAGFYGAARVSPYFVAAVTLEWKKRVGEWPHPWQVHRHIAARVGCPLELAEFDVQVALERGYVYGLHSVVAMRLGEAFGDWRGSLGPEDNGFRLAVLEEHQ